jgi:hypothetical protein
LGLILAFTQACLLRELLLIRTIIGLNKHLSKLSVLFTQCTP